MSGSVKMTYRAWVDAGARGHFMTAGVTVNAVRLINPADIRGGYFVRRDTSDPQQAERRALLSYTDQENGERIDDTRLPDYQRRRVVAYDMEPEGASAAADERPGWILTHRVERPAEVVRRGWLPWEIVGEVSEREPAWTREVEMARVSAQQEMTTTIKKEKKR